MPTYLHKLHHITTTFRTLCTLEMPRNSKEQPQNDHKESKKISFDPSLFDKESETKVLHHHHHRRKSSRHHHKDRKSRKSTELSLLSKKPSETVSTILPALGFDSDNSNAELLSEQSDVNLPKKREVPIVAVEVDDPREPGLVSEISLVHSPEEVDGRVIYTNEYFNAPIRPNRKFGEGVETVPEVIFEHGAVTSVTATSEVIDMIDEFDRLGEKACRWCYDDIYKVSPELERNVAVQGRLFCKVLLIEMMLHIPSFAWLAIQYNSKALHDWIYTQWLLGIFIILILNIPIVFGVIFSNFGDRWPSGLILLIPKTLSHAHFSAVATVMMEGGIARWRWLWFDLDDPTSLESIAIAQADPAIRFTYPFIVPLLLFKIMVFELVFGFFFLLCKLNVKHNRMFWLALLLQLSVFTLEINILYEIIPTSFLVGPGEWEYTQIFVSGFSSCTWSLWRLYNLRVVLEGVKFPLTEKSHVLVALSFAT